jgi:hypothetical protein
MKRVIAAVVTSAIVGAVTCTPISAAAAENAALKKATADCKAQVKDYAKYNETSWHAQRKMVKKCIADAMEKNS